jgi:hypothetical protein
VDHFVYRLTAKIPINGKIYYVGKHSGNLNDFETGAYKTSSDSVKPIFSLDLFNVKIVKIFSSAKEAVAFESKYHSKVNAKMHPLFFNNANQSYPYNGNGFDRSGITTVIDKETNKNITIPSEIYANNKEKYQSVAAGKVLCKDKFTGEKMTVPKEVFENSPNLVGINYGLVHVRDLSGKKVTVSKEYYENHKDEFLHPGRDKVCAFDKIKNKFVSIAKDEFESNKERYAGANVPTGFKYVSCDICGNHYQFQNIENHRKIHSKDIYVKHKITEEAYIVKDELYWKIFKENYIKIGHISGSDDFFGCINGKKTHIRYLGKLIKKLDRRLK